jgi:hypothetical protein
MTWSTIKSTGRGRWQFRLSIEGYPAQWVTHTSVTHADGTDGRAVYSGLSHDFEIRDRVLMMEGKLEADAINFKIVAVDSEERPMASFTLFPEPVGFLQDALDEDDTTMTLQGGKGLDAGIYHIGTEAIAVTSSGGGTNTITRTKWSTLAQKHNVANFDKTRWVAVYDSPPTMEGRRAYLFVYGDGDDLDGNGTCIWRGIVARPPRQDSAEPSTYMIEVQPISAVLQQTIAGKIKEVKPLKLISHHVQCPFVIQMFYDGTTSDPVYVVGAKTEADLAEDVTSALNTLAFTTFSIGTLDWIKFDKSKNGRWRVRLKTNDIVADFNLILGSPICGTVHAYKAHWTDKDGNEVLGVGNAISSAFALQANKEYFVELVIDNTNAAQYSYRYTGIVTYDGPPMQPLGNASILMVPASRGTGSIFYDDADASQAALHINRIWIDTDLSDYVGGTIHLTNTYNPTGIYKITDADLVVVDNGDGTNTNYFWVELELYTGHTGSFNGLTQEEINKQIIASKTFDGFVTADTKINVIRDFGTGTDVVGFETNLKDASVSANDGDVPFFTDADASDWFLTDGWKSQYQFNRNYRFVAEHTLEDIFAEELKFVGHFPRIGDDGRIEIKGLPSFTDATTTDTAHTIDGSSIITPADGYGAWPGWDPQRDGILTTVSIKDVYDPLKDDWRDKDMVFQDPDAIATHKSRGKAQMTIAPFSAPNASVRGSARDIFETIASQYLNFFARDYAIVTLRVPFKHYDVLCGDVCTLTHRLIPAGDGTRGVVSRKAVCVERRWHMDPKSNQWGELSFYLPRSVEKGYSPSAIVTGQSNTSGNTWAITCALVSNETWSTNGDGKALEHFQSGDFVHVWQLDTTSVVEVNGQVDSAPNVAAGTLSITFTGTWTPSTSLWAIGFRQDTDGAHSTTAQKKYAFDANSSYETGDGAQARQFQ